MRRHPFGSKSLAPGQPVSLTTILNQNDGNSYKGNTAYDLSYRSVSHGCNRRRGERLTTLWLFFAYLLCEQRIERGETLDLDRIAGRIQKEHRRLFAGFALEADVGFYLELGAGGLQFLRYLCPLGDR